MHGRGVQELFSRHFWREGSRPEEDAEDDERPFHLGGRLSFLEVMPQLGLYVLLDCPCNNR